MSLLESVRTLDEIIGQSRFHFAAQPILSAVDHACFGHELLVRGENNGWSDGSPGRLFEAAFRRGRWSEMDEAFLRAAMDYRDATTGATFLNTHIDSLLRDPVAEMIAREARRRDRTNRLVVEVSEHTPVEDWRPVRVRMEEIAAHGAAFALDDFGAGHANLKAVFEAPLDYLKTDQSLIKQASQDATRLRMFADLVRLSANGGIETVCEGVENDFHQQVAIDCGCDLLQGFHLGRPRRIARIVPADGDKAAGNF